MTIFLTIAGTIVYIVVGCAVGCYLDTGAAVAAGGHGQPRLARRAAWFAAGLVLWPLVLLGLTGLALWEVCRTLSWGSSSEP